MPHEWDKNTPSKGWSRCAKCGMEVKTYRVRKGGLPTCEEFKLQQIADALKQTKLDEKPACEHDKSSLACLNCQGRFDTKLCDELRKRLTPLKPPLSGKSS